MLSTAACLLARARVPLVAAIVVAEFAATPIAQAPAAPPPDLEPYVARVMKVFDVPGIAVALVKDGALVLTRGYGVRDLRAGTPVDADTLFGIASNTKAFTAAALGTLVDDGQIEWDGSVIRHLPWFQMWDPYVTRELTVRDLLVHRSGLGLGAGDLLTWPPTTYDRKEVVRRIRFIQPATSFRNAYAYDNNLYIVAGELIEAASGRTWEQFVQERILARVGMMRTRVRYTEAAGDENVARPHVPIGGIVQPVDAYADSDNANPAGSIYSSANDMAKWLTVLLQGGRLSDGSRLLSPPTMSELTTMVTPMPIVEPAPELLLQRMNFNGYALGFRVHDYRGRKVVTHTGGNLGNVTRVTMVPELGLGVVVLTNQDSREAYDSITFRVLDHYLGLQATDWVDAYSRVRARQRRGVAESESEAASARDVSSRPSLPLGRYAGTYSDVWYGNIDIAQEDGRLGLGLVMRFTRTPSLVGDLHHWQHDTFVVRWRDRALNADAYVTFSLEPDGTVDQAKMRAVSPETDFSYDFHDLLLRPVKRGQR